MDASVLKFKEGSHSQDNSFLTYSSSPIDFYNNGHHRVRSRSPVARNNSSRSPINSRDMERVGGSSQDSSKIRLVVSNIPFESRWQDIKDLYKEKVSQDGCYAEILESADGKSLGSAVIEVRGRDLADKTISILSECEMKGRKLYVREERERDRERMQAQKRGGGGGGDQRGMMGGMNGAGSMGPMMGRGYGGGGGVGACLSMPCLQFLAKHNIDPECISNQIFIANLDYKVTAKKVTEVFQMAGNILQVDVKVDKEGNSRGMATVCYENPIEAVQAVAMFNNQYLYERQMNVKMDRLTEITPQFIPNKLPQGLGNFAMGLGEGGQPLTNIVQISNILTLSSLSFLSSGSANAMGGMAGFGIGSLMASLAGSFNCGMGGGGNWGSSMDRGGGMMFGGGGMMSDSRGASMGGSRLADVGSTTLLVKNLPYSTTWQDLKDRFKQVGDVKFAEIKMENGRSKGYGTVKFSSSEDARRAINVLNGSMFENRQIESIFAFNQQAYGMGLQTKSKNTLNY